MEMGDLTSLLAPHPSGRKLPCWPNAVEAMWSKKAMPVDVPDRCRRGSTPTVTDDRWAVSDARCAVHGRWTLAILQICWTPSSLLTSRRRRSPSDRGAQSVGMPTSRISTTVEVTLPACRCVRKPPEQ